MASELHARAVPPLDALVELPAGRYRLGEPGEERAVALERVLIARWPVVNAHLRAFAAATGRSRSPKHDDPQLADHPATDVTCGDAEAFCAWASRELDRHVRLPDADEWEALARGTDARLMISPRLALPRRLRRFGSRKWTYPRDVWSSLGREVSVTNRHR